MIVENIKIIKATEGFPVMDSFVGKGLVKGGHSALPDIDVDYASDRRQEIKEYLEERYNTEGRQRVFSAGTFTTLKLKAALKDVGRVYRIPHSIVNYITAMLDDNMDWTDLFRVAAVNRKVWSFVQTYPEVIEEVRGVMGQPKASSIHASAIIVTPEKRNGRTMECFDFLPIRKMEDQLVSEFDGYSVDSIGLLKEDVLATKELSKLSATIHLVNETYGTHYSIESITQEELEDEKTYRMLSDGYTQNVFQFSSRGITRFIQDVHPDGIEDLIAINALYRPATLDVGATDDYVRYRRGEVVPVYNYGCYEATKNTYGLLVYQEQFISVAHTLAGFDLGKADVLRKCVDEDSLFWTEQGYVRIKDLQPGTGVHVISPTGCISKYNKVNRVLLPQMKECIRITTRSGKELVCTGDHRILTNHGWVEAKDAKGAFVIRDLVEKYGSYSEDWRKTYITVALITEGTCASDDYSMTFTNKDKSKIDLFINCIESYLECNDYKTYCDKKGVMRVLINRKYLDDIQVKSVKSKAHELPFEYLSFNKHELLRCLGWMIDFDGFILSKNGNIYYSSKSHKLVHQVQYIFDNTGVKSNIIKKYNKRYNEYYYEIYVTDHKDNKRLHELLKDYSKKVAEFKFWERIRVTASNFSLYQVPYNVWYPSISRLISNSGYSKNELMNSSVMSNITKNVPLTHERLNRILHICGRNRWLEFVAGNNVFYDEIVSIETAGERVVYDFKMADGVQPLACVNGMVVHNCIGKKKADLMATLKTDFITGAIANGCPDYEAEEIWHKIEVAGKYSFNRSHAAAYALTAYCGAWLKANYSTAFYTVALQWADDKEIPLLMSEMELCSSAHIVPPEINRSGISFFTDYGTNEIFWSLNRIKIVGGKTAKYIVDERQRGGAYTSIENFIHRIFRYKLKKYEYWDDPDNQEEATRIPVNARHVKNLVLAGCFDQIEGIQAVTERYAVLDRAAHALGFALQEKEFPEDLREKHYFWSQQQIVVSGIGSIDYRRIFDHSEMRARVKGKASYMTLRDALQGDNEGKRITVCATVTEVSENSYKDKASGEKKRFGKLMLQQNNDLMECVCWNDFYMEHRNEISGLKDQVVILTAIIRYNDYKGCNGLQTYKTSLISKL